MTEANEPEDVQRLLVAFGPRVYGLMLRMVGRSDVAEDLMQETLVRALRSADTYRPEGKFQAWLFRIAVNLARDWLRRRPREPGAILDDEAPAAPALRQNLPPDTRLSRQEQARRVEIALARLAGPDREILLMRYYGDLAFKDIAQATGEPLGTVLARAHRALKKLGDLIPEEVP